ncbi:hypothetical protein QMK19_07340 [Streptomyces sp. H10-C2]|uniref:hypothetical protein n=1 Tax=unclassified Streptomyces TaxID=2593676 RepID=UPI0024BA6BC5|nr:MULTISPECIES: hypothetical protein [unclassified Streptomyces]MDJ0341158.1 hypothetical protein [Streptomyces sp. PH10-H1]MDJ0369490.1 hypothetical protein [Streptomyces sp. H10-C2]
MSTERNEDTVERSAARPRLRSPLAVAAMAAAVLVAGGGGAYWATANAGHHTANASPKSGPPAPLALEGAKNGTAAVAGSDGAAPAGGQYRATVPLPNGPKSAPVYRPQGELPRETVEKLAKALGVPGPVKLDHDFWRAGGAPDGGGPTLQVNRAGAGNWSYSRLGAITKCAVPSGGVPSGGVPSGAVPNGAVPNGGGPDAAVCSGIPTGAADGAAGSSTSSSGPSGAGGGAVSEDRAKQVAAPVLAAVGLTGARTDASETTGAVRLVNADPVVGGLPTHGWRTTLQIGADGQLSGGYGLLAALDKGDDYPVIGAAQALKELETAGSGGSDHGVGGSCPALPKPKPTAPSDDKTLPQTLPCVPSAEQTLEVRGAAFGLSAQFVSGARALVPSWLFDVAQAGVLKPHTVAQPAVAAQYIQQPGATTVPGGTGGPGGSGPGATSRPTEPADPGMPADPKAPQKQKAVSYTVRGSALELHFWGGVCSTYSAFADESGSAVTVRITGTADHPGQPCILLAKDITQTVKLTRPLGDRKVVDLYDGAVVPAKK